MYTSIPYTLYIYLRTAGSSLHIFDSSSNSQLIQVPRSLIHGQFPQLSRLSCQCQEGLEKKTSTVTSSRGFEAWISGGGVKFFLGEKWNLWVKSRDKKKLLTVLVSLCLFVFREKIASPKKVGILGGTWQLLFCFTLWGVVWFDSIKTKHFNQRLKEFWTSDQHESNLPNTSLTCGVLLLLTNPTEPTIKGLRFTSSYRVILEVVKNIGCNTPYRSCNTQLWANESISHLGN